MGVMTSASLGSSLEQWVCPTFDVCTPPDRRDVSCSRRPFGMTRESSIGNGGSFRKRPGKLQIFRRTGGGGAAQTHPVYRRHCVKASQGGNDNEKSASS